MKPNQESPRHLAWQETLELHELVASQSVHLAVFKKKLPTVHDPALRALYTEAVQGLEQNLRELLLYYPQAPVMQRSDQTELSAAVESGTLLGFAKNAVKSYAAAITETATPQLRETFTKHLLNAIALHAKVFNYMYERGLYPAYNLDLLLANDVKNANAALSM